MKVFLNPILQQSVVCLKNKGYVEKNNTQTTSDVHYVQRPILSSVNFSNISFGMEPGARFLLDHTDRLICAYSGREMISPKLAKKITDKLAKTPNVQSAVNYLFQYQDKYMHPIESEIFDIFNDKNIKKYYGNKTFKDILEYLKPDALSRLLFKQTNILMDTNCFIDKLSQPVQDMVIMIRNEAMTKIMNGTFGRKSPLEMLSRIKATGRDAEILKLIYKEWYKLPSSSTDIDAFIVSYSKMSHEQIAKRLVSSAFATIEHVRPKTRGGRDCLSNYLLVSAEYNNSRSALPLNDYIKLHRNLNIKDNLQLYLDIVKYAIKYKDPAFMQHQDYVAEIAETIEKETKGQIKLDTTGISLPKEGFKERACRRLSKKYQVK